MLQASSGFKQAIKADMRECVAKVRLNYSTPLVLFKDMIQGIDISSSADLEIGSIQNDNLNVRLMKNSITDAQFNQKVDVEVFIGCKVDSGYEYVSIGTFLADGWSKNDATGIITIRLTNKINTNAVPQENVIGVNESLKAYIGRVIQKVFGEPVIVGNILDATLPSAYLYYEDIKTQLKQLAMATNGLFRYVNGFELVPYKATTPVDTLKIGANELVMNVSRITDYSAKAPNVQILKTFFSKSEVISLFSSGNINLPASASQYPVEISLGYPVVAKYFSFKKYGYLSDYKVGVFKSTLYINNGYDTPRSVSVEVFGTKIISTTLGTKVSDGSITYIENPYIQLDSQVANIDKRIYSGISYRVAYRGNPTLQIGDTVAVEGIGNVLITKHSLNFTGALSGIIEGVCISG